MKPRTLFDKIWDAHVVVPETDAAPAVLYIDLHLLHEVTTPQAFTELATRGLSPRRVDRCIATIDHSTPTLPADASGKLPYASAASEQQVDALRENCAKHGIELFDMGVARESTWVAFEAVRREHPGVSSPRAARTHTGSSRRERRSRGPAPTVPTVWMHKANTLGVHQPHANSA